MCKIAACRIPGFRSDRRFPLYLRYQTTHDRAFHQTLNQLLKLSCPSLGIGIPV